MPSEITRVHDRFFRKFFSKPEVSGDFVRHYLPASINAHLEPESLELENDSFVDKELREHFSDLIFRVKLKDGSGAYLYLLLEHKSYPAPLVAFQLLRYMVRIWERAVGKLEKKKRHRSSDDKAGPVGRPDGEKSEEPVDAEAGTSKQKKKGFSKERDTAGGATFRLPPIIPVVIYHGKSEWQVRTDFMALFEVPRELAGGIPNFNYIPVDISHRSDEELKGMVLLRVVLLIMKYVFREDLVERLPGIFELLRELTTKQSGIEYLETIVRYLSAGTSDLEEGDLARAVEKALPSIGDEVMATLAEKWMMQGKREGRIEGLLSGLETGLELKFGEEGARSLLPELRRVKDFDVLVEINKGLWATDSLEQLREILASRQQVKAADVSAPPREA